MGRRSKLGLGVVIVAGAVAAWGGMQVFAAGSPATSATGSGKVTAAAALVPAGAKLYKTWVNTGQNSTSMPGGSYPTNIVNIDSPTSIHCPAPLHQTCMLVVNTHVQVGVSGGANNRVFVIPYVDGNPISPGPFLGFIPSGAYAGFSWQDGIATLPAGLHTVQTGVGSDSTAIQPGYSVEYSVYTK